MDPASIEESSGAPPRILLTRLRYLGDVILTTPAIEAARECFPGAEIYYMAEAPYSDVLMHHPGLDGIIEASNGLSGTIRTVMELRRMRFAAAVDMFYNPRSANLLYLAGIPVRVGGTRRWRRRLYTHRFEAGRKGISAVEHHLSAVSALGCETDRRMPRIHVSDEEMSAGTGRIRGLFDGRVPSRTVAFHPGGTWPSKRWRAERFSELARLAAGETGASVLLVTGPGEERLTGRIEAETPASVRRLPLVGLRELAGVLSSCDAAVSNDGGVLHMAVALGRPTVGVFGPTEPDIWFPYEGRGPYRVITRNETCAPCHLHRCDDMRCLDNISAAEVLEGLRDVTGW